MAKQSHGYISFRKINTGRIDRLMTPIIRAYLHDEAVGALTSKLFPVNRSMLIDEDPPIPSLIKPREQTFVVEAVNRKTPARDE